MSDSPKKESQDPKPGDKGRHSPGPEEQSPIEDSASMTGFLSNVSPVKKARRSNTEYFNATLQNSPTSFQRIVCYEPSKQPSFVDAERQAQPVKINNLEIKNSKLKEYENELKVSNSSSIIANQTVDFEPTLPLTEVKAAEVKVSQLSSLPPGSKVTLTTYVNIEDRPIVETELSYLKDPIAKRDVAINDDTGIIPLSLWGEKVSLVPSSGTYHLKNVVLKQSAKCSYYISTNTKSEITASETKIARNNQLPSDLISYTVALPPITVHSTSLRYFCNHCKKFTINQSPNPILFVCQCGGNQMAIRLTRKVQSKLEVNTEKGVKTVHVGGPQMSKYFQLKNKSLPNSTDELVEIPLLFLQESEMKMIVDARFNCIGFKA